MKILVIGQSVVDKINSPVNKVTQAGGIYYSVLGLNSIKAPGDEFYLISSVSKNSYKYFADEYDKVNKKYLTWSDLIPTVTLNIFNDRERDEQYDSINSALFVKYNVLNEFDGILLNMITGFDVSLTQLKRIRSEFKGTIYFDVHSMARRIGKNMKREFRVIPNFSEWAKNVDIIQVNETEFKCLTNEKDELKIACSVLNYGVKYLIKTMGNKGFRIYGMNRGEVTSVFHSAKKVKAGAFVGCGDVFGSVFFYNYIKGDSLKNILLKANKASGFAASCSDVESMKKLSNEL